MALTSFDLAGHFADSANELVAARGKALKLHRNKDIDAAGDEVEIPIRELLHAKLSRRYYIGHGHIVDSRLSTSRQLDVIIADDANTPVLSKSKNGTEFMPYESVYAIGEARSAYYKSKKPIQAFSEVLQEIGTGLNRQKITFAAVSNGHTNVVRDNPNGLNPLFSFMLFVAGDEFQFSDVKDFYRTTPAAQLPSIVCVLDKGIIMDASFLSPKVPPQPAPADPNFGTFAIVDSTTPIHGNANPRWAFIKAEDADEGMNRGVLLATVFTALSGSLSATTLQPPDMPTYLRHILEGYPVKVEN